MRRRRGLVPVQRVRAVSRGPAEPLHQHAHQDKTGAPGLEHSGRGTANTPASSIASHRSTPVYSFTLPALTGPQPPAPPTYLSISRGLLTSPALQNSKGNVVPNKGKKHQQQKFLIMLKKTPKESGTVMKTTTMTNGRYGSSLI